MLSNLKYIFCGESDVNGVKMLTTWSKWPKMAKITSIWPKNDVICQNWVNLWKFFFCRKYPDILLNNPIYTFVELK